MIISSVIHAFDTHYTQKIQVVLTILIAQSYVATYAFYMIVRATGILIENAKILLLDQDVNAKRRWSLPGGKVEADEKLGDCLIREVREETGLDVEIVRLLYVCDLITEKAHVLHITFEIRPTGGTLGKIAKGIDKNKIRAVKMIPVSELVTHGFGKKFQELVEQKFPRAGSYMGEKKNIGL